MKVLYTFVLCACILSVVAAAADSWESGLAVNVVPTWDLCVNGGDIFSCSGHGTCSNGACKCTDGYTGRDCSKPPGGFPYQTTLASVTQFCQLETGGCAAGMCVGGGKLDKSSLPPGVDGVAAVNPTLYGSRYAYANTAGGGVPYTLNGMYSFAGQSCGTCWKLTRKSISIVVTVVDRCAGYCRATVGDNQSCTKSNPQGAKECGECILNNQPSIPQCSCLSPNSTQHQGWCNGYKTAHCDWCAANDHPHFDLDITAQMKICGDAAGDGFCTLDSFQMVPCAPLQGPWPNGTPGKKGTPAPSYASSGSASTPDVDPNAKKCGYKTSDNVCHTATQGQYFCDGCSLAICNEGNVQKFGCGKGTICQNGECVLGTNTALCDLAISGSCAASNSSSATAPASPTTAPPPISGTTKPTATVAPTTAPTQSAGNPTTAPPAPTLRPNHPCQARKRRMEITEEEAVAENVVVEKSELESAPALVEEKPAPKPVESSASTVVASFLAAFVAFILYF